jgi:hypothetical protein
MYVYPSFITVCVCVCVCLCVCVSVIRVCERNRESICMHFCECLYMSLCVSVRFNLTASSSISYGQILYPPYDVTDDMK